MLTPDFDPHVTPDKRSYEQKIVAAFTAMVEDCGKGDYRIELAGSYPDTKVNVSGLGLVSRQPRKWAFPLWDFWEEMPTINATATLMYGNMDD